MLGIEPWNNLLAAHALGEHLPVDARLSAVCKVFAIA